jgi:hypothetical protein
MVICGDCGHLIMIGRLISSVEVDVSKLSEGEQAAWDSIPVGSPICDECFAERLALREEDD